MATEVLVANNDLKKWVSEGEDGAATLLRVPLRERTNGRQLGVFGFHLAKNVFMFTVSGLDRPGILAYLARALKKFDLNVESCAGEKLLSCQGCEFEMTTSDAEELREKLFRLCEFLLHEGLEPGRLVPFDRVYDLYLDVPHDATGLLCPVADLLAANDVNLRKFRADNVFGVPDGPVSVFARLEVPVGLDLEWLYGQVVEACPPGSEVKLKSGYELVDGRPQKTNRVFPAHK
jgi:predicted amino acid-binding ACT domain protein